MWVGAELALFGFFSLLSYLGGRVRAAKSLVTDRAGC